MRIGWILLLVLLPRLSLAETTIVRDDPAIKRHTFDPKHRPKDMPELNLGESAITRTNFKADAQVRGARIQSRQVGSSYQVVMRIDSIDMKIGLDVDVWV